jgi:hypothetical protein
VKNKIAVLAQNDGSAKAFEYIGPRGQTYRENPYEFAPDFP